MPLVRLVNPHQFGHAGGSGGREKLSDKVGAIVRNSLRQEMQQLRSDADKDLGVQSKPIEVNPGGFQRGAQNMAKKHHHRQHHRNPHARRRRHRNPIMAMSTQELLKSLAFAAAGNIATDLVPNALGVGSGILGYGASAATALAASYLAGKFAGSTAATSTLIGGGLAVLRKVLNDYFPNTILASGMSGDLAFYINNGFPIPTAGQGPYLLNAGYSGSTPQMNGGLPAAVPQVVASNGQPATAAGTPAALPAPAAQGGGWRGEGRWAA